MEFMTRQELIKDLNNNYEQEGMVLTIKISKEKQVVMKCDRSREYINMLNLTNETRQKETQTRELDVSLRSSAHR
jgi:hypothetical protein